MGIPAKLKSHQHAIHSHEIPKAPVVRRDWNFAKSGKPDTIIQRFNRSQAPAKRLEESWAFGRPR
jgi:hypothetical protein